MDIDGVKRVRKWINTVFNDHVVKILLKNSSLSNIQLESLLIDVLAEKILDYKIKYEDKAKLRLTNEMISRGAFNRSLKQAKNNILKSTNTIILLGYLGIFKSSKLEPLIEISNRINYFVSRYRNLLSEQNKMNKNERRIFLDLKYELENSLKKISI